jgi:hypothetical protein
MLDLFNGSSSAHQEDFMWSVAVFRATGASEVIKRANQHELHTFYPFRRTRNGDLIPLWRNYLFIEFKQILTLNICRSTSNFIKILSIPDEEGQNQPVLVRKNVINDSMRFLQIGKFDDVAPHRRFYGRGSYVSIINGDLLGKKVELLSDIPSDMSSNKRVAISIGGWRATIEVFNLAL